MNSIDDRYITVFYRTAPPQIKECIKHFRKVIFNKYKDHGNKVDTEYWVAGGAVRDFFLRREPADIDLYFPSENEKYEIESRIANLRRSPGTLSMSVRENKNVLKLTLTPENLTIDLVKLYYKTAQDAIRSFDFTVCAAAVAPNYMVYHKNFFLDITTKSLVLNSSPNSLNILYRLQKYIKKGYHMSNGDLLEIIKTINNLNITQEDIEECEKSNEWEYRRPVEVGIPF